MTHVAPHGIPHLCNRQLLPQLSDIGLQREAVRINRVDELVKTGTESPFIRPNQHDFSDEHSKMQVNRENRECDCCGGRCDTCCSHKKNTPPIRELYYPSEGNMQKCNGKYIRS